MLPDAMQKFSCLLILLSFSSIIVFVLFAPATMNNDNSSGLQLFRYFTGTLMPNKNHDFLNIIDPTKFSNERFNCIEASVGGKHFPFCIYDAKDDMPISSGLLANKYYEKNSVEKILRILKDDCSLQMVDIGANLGTYTLAVGHLKDNPVLSIEPNFPTMQRLGKSIVLGNITNYVTLVHNAVSDEHKMIYLNVNSANRGDTVVDEKFSGINQSRSVQVGTITLDDILPLMKYRKAIIKVDAQCHENRIFSKTAEVFFERIDVKMILMEWAIGYCKYRTMNAATRAETNEWLKFFYGRNYTVFDPVRNIQLRSNWETWPFDIIFKKK